MRDAFQLQEQLVGVLIGSAAKLASIVGQDLLDRGRMGLEERRHVFVEYMHGGHRQLAGAEPARGKAAGAVEHGLRVDLPDAFETAN